MRLTSEFCLDGSTVNTLMKVVTSGLIKGAIISVSPIEMVEYAECSDRSSPDA
jgi:hypothetical protein